MNEYKEKKIKIPHGLLFSTEKIISGTEGTIIEYCVAALNSIEPSLYEVIVEYGFFNAGSLLPTSPFDPKPVDSKVLNLKVTIKN